jgi:hypothetical protein
MSSGPATALLNMGMWPSGVDTHGLMPVALEIRNPDQPPHPSEAFTPGLTPRVLSRGFDRPRANSGMSRHAGKIEAGHSVRNSARYASHPPLGF